MIEREIPEPPGESEVLDFYQRSSDAFRCRGVCSLKRLINFAPLALLKIVPATLVPVEILR